MLDVIIVSLFAMSIGFAAGLIVGRRQEAWTDKATITVAICARKGEENEENNAINHEGNGRIEEAHC